MIRISIDLEMQKRVNINEPYEVEYCTKELGISQNALQGIIDMVGDSVEKIRDYINRTKK